MQWQVAVVVQSDTPREWDSVVAAFDGHLGEDKTWEYINGPLKGWAEFWGGREWVSVEDALSRCFAEPDSPGLGSALITPDSVEHVWDKETEAEWDMAAQTILRQWPEAFVTMVRCHS